MERLSTRNGALALMALGVLAVLVGLLADVIGYGAEGFGPAQVGLVVVGVALAAFGYYRFSKL
jgi:hypothetical protein